MASRKTGLVGVLGPARRAKAAGFQPAGGIVCHLLAGDYREVIAYGAGWSDRARQQPVGDGGRHESRHIDAIVDAQFQRARDDPSRSGHRVARRPLGRRVRARRRRRHALQGARHRAHGPQAVRRAPRRRQPAARAVWDFLLRMLSPTLVTLHRDAFVVDDGIETTVALAEHRGESILDQVDLSDDDDLDPAA